MDREKNIFFGLIKNENSMTELFCNFLQFKSFRDTVLGLFLEKNELNSIKFEDIDTQCSLPNNKGRPDMIISNDSVKILFELKTEVDTPLTENQPFSYLEYLRTISSKTKWLIFFTPP